MIRAGWEGFTAWLFRGDGRGWHRSALNSRRLTRNNANSTLGGLRWNGHISHKVRDPERPTPNPTRNRYPEPLRLPMHSASNRGVDRNQLTCDPASYRVDFNYIVKGPPA